MKLLELIATALAVLRTGHYILNENGQPIPADLDTWARWFEKRDRILKQEWIGRSWVSTVFLGLDHNYSEEGPPILWETLVFGGKLKDEMTRCSGSREQAEAMHEEMVKRVYVTEEYWIPFMPLFRAWMCVKHTRPARYLWHLKAKLMLWKLHRYSRKDDKRRRKKGEI